MMLNGMYTGLLGVAEQLVHGLEKRPVSLRLTDLERTLIDITVRPYYGGGIDSVLLAYQRASDQVDGVKLAQYLVDLDYVYPFHQAVGWYMTKAGYSEDQMRGIKAQPLVRRFYLTHKMETPAFNDNWQIYVPSNLN
jgi:predicted transcriptional regulator of viral defense system